MTILVAVTDSEEGDSALRAAADEAVLRDAKLLVANLRLSSLDVSGLPDQVDAKVLERPPGVDVVDHVLDLLDEHHEDVRLLVIGMKRRSPVGKLVLGSITQRLLLQADVPVLAVKAGGQES
jgi:nucleotide-binding universal stress UspA family protein